MVARDDSLGVSQRPNYQCLTFGENVNLTLFKFTHGLK